MSSASDTYPARRALVRAPVMTSLAVPSRETGWEYREDMHHGYLDCARVKGNWLNARCGAPPIPEAAAVGGDLKAAQLLAYSEQFDMQTSCQNYHARHGGRSNRHHRPGAETSYRSTTHRERHLLIGRSCCDQRPGERRSDDKTILGSLVERTRRGRGPRKRRDRGAEFDIRRWPTSMRAMDPDRRIDGVYPRGIRWHRDRCRSGERSSRHRVSRWWIRDDREVIVIHSANPERL